MRKQHGFDHISVLTREEDLEMVKKQYEMTQLALKRSGTGRLEDVNRWYQDLYPEEFKWVCLNSNLARAASVLSHSGVAANERPSYQGWAMRACTAVQG